MADNNDTLQTIAGTLGNVLEWYDFGIYGFFSDTIAQVFFPPGGEHNLIYSYLVFGGAFLMRPMGGLITGNIGDMHGRKRALVFSLFCMTVPTVAMGFLPTYEQVGGWSTALLVICRLLQGFSVGGQLPSSLVYTLETKPKEHWGYYGSMFSLACGIGSVFGNLVGALLRTLLNEEQMLQWGWRVAFFTGVLILPVAIYLHLYGKEVHPNAGEYDNEDEENDGLDELIVEQETTTSEPRSERSNAALASITSSVIRQTRPLQYALKRDNLPALLSAFLTPMLAGAGYYITFVWMAIYMAELLDPPVKGAFWINLLASVFHISTSVLAGWLSDKHGRNKVMAVGAVSVGIFAPVMLYIISLGKSVDAFFAQFCIGVLLAFFSGPIFAWLPEKFPPKVRLTSAALGWNIGICLSAGFSPAVATALVHKFGAVAPSVIYPFFAVVALIGMYVSTKVHKEEGSSSTVGDTKVTIESDFTDEASTHLL